MSHTILIADDDEFLTQMYRLALEGAERTVFIARDGEQALELLEQHKPEVLVLDLLMPKVDGFGVLEKMREKGLKCQVIILSNITDTVDRDRCINLGANDFYTKSSTNLEGLAEMVVKHFPAS